MKLPIPDRTAAGQALAKALQKYQNQDHVIVLALPRGGVPVAYEIAMALKAPLDLMLVRKLGAPHFPELAMGAIASGGIRVLNEQVIASYAIQEDDIATVEAKEREELRRRDKTYRGDRPHPNLQDQTVILVDDGLATGSTMLAALEAVQLQHPKAIVVAVPVAPPDTVYRLQKIADEVICPIQPDDFYAIGQWYADFSQVSDAEVIAQLNQAWQS